MNKQELNEKLKQFEPFGLQYAEAMKKDHPERLAANVCPTYDEPNSRIKYNDVIKHVARSYLDYVLRQITTSLLRVQIFKDAYEYHNPALMVRTKCDDNDYPENSFSFDITLLNGETAEVVFFANSEDDKKLAEKEVQDLLNGQPLQKLIDDFFDREADLLYGCLLENDWFREVMQNLGAKLPSLRMLRCANGNPADNAKELIEWVSRLSFLGLYGEDYLRGAKGSPAEIFYPTYPGVIHEFGSTISQTETKINKYFSEKVKNMAYELLKVFILKTGYFFRDDSFIIRLKKPENCYPPYCVKETIRLWETCEEAEVVFMARSEKRAQWVGNWISKALNGRTFQEVLQEALKNNSISYIEQLENDPDLEFVLKIDSFAGNCSTPASYRNRCEVKYSSYHFSQEKLNKVCGFCKDSEEDLFFITQEAGEKLASFMDKGGSCESLGNLYTFDKQHRLLTISEQKTGVILRQLRIDDGWTFSMAIQ